MDYPFITIVFTQNFGTSKSSTYGSNWLLRILFALNKNTLKSVRMYKMIVLKMLLKFILLLENISIRYEYLKPLCPGWYHFNPWRFGDVEQLTLLLFPVPFSRGLVVSIKVLSMGKIKSSMIYYEIFPYLQVFQATFNSLIIMQSE